METSLVHCTGKMPKSKPKNCPFTLKKSRTRNNNNYRPQNEVCHHNLASHYRHRHILPRASLPRHHRTRNYVDACHDAKLKSEFAVKCGQSDRKAASGEVLHQVHVGDGNRHGEDLNNRELVVGKFTREVYNAICLRLGDTLHIPEDSVKALFNDMHLFPSDTQVTKMLQCARQYSRRNGTNPNYLTFGEFCVLVREMQNHPSPKPHRKLSQQKLINNKCPNNKCEVFLGGSCNPTTWRADTAIPELQKLGISFYNPQVSMWAPELLAQEHDAKQSASVLLFVIDSQTRSTVGMLEVAYLVACGRCVIVVAQPYRKGQSIMGEVISDREYHNLVQGQKSLLDLIKSKGVQIHTNLSTALQCTADILRNASLNGTSPEEQVTFKLRRLREMYDSYDGQMRISDILDAYRRLTNRSLEISKLYNYFNLQNANGTDGAGLSFEKFCALMAELSTDECGMCNIETWASQSFTRNQHTQCSAAPALDPALVSSSSPSDGDYLYDVYLGGSLSTGTKWRESVAIPLLERKGLRYFNPAMRDPASRSTEDHRHNSDARQDDVSRWRHEIGRCKVALFVITNDTRSLTSMILAAHYIGIGQDVVLSVEQLNGDSCVVANELLTKTAIKDYNRARAYLRDLAERRQVPVFEGVDRAVRCAVSKLAKTPVDPDGQTTETRTDLNR